MRYGKIILFTLAMSLAACAQDPFTGKWKLNLEKSKYSPGPAIKSETVTLDADGKATIDEVDADGKPLVWSYGPSQGKEVPITGMGQNSSVSDKRMGNTVEHKWKMAGTPSTGKGVVSKDGKTMTYRLKGKTPDGKPVNNVMFFERVQ